MNVTPRDRSRSRGGAPGTARRRVAGALAAGATLAGLLAGCSTHPGAAAVVDGHEISSAEFAATLEELEPVFGPGGVSPQVVLQTLVVEPTVVALAEENGLGVSQEDAIALLDASFDGVGAPRPESYTAGSVAIARWQLAWGNLQGAENGSEIGEDFTQRIADLDVEVNPRFGSYDAGTLTGPTTPSWIVGASAQ